MEEIQQVQFEIEECKIAFEKAYQEYREGVRKYDKLAQKKKELVIEVAKKKKDDEKKKYEEEKEEIYDNKHIYSNIIKVLNKTERRGRPKKRREVFDRCGIEVLYIDKNTELKTIRKYCKLNKVKRYTKMNRLELVKSLLDL